MGLLDEAIREHLELKRRRGADPGEVAREEREALAPVPEDEDGAADFGDEHASGGHADERHADGDRFSAIGQETAELDMQAVLDEDPQAALGGEPEAPEDDDFGWETPDEHELGHVPEEVPGQERLSFE